MLSENREKKSGQINASWHKKNPMPKNPTLKERAAWHIAHATACGCRPIPKSVASFLRKQP